MLSGLVVWAAHFLGVYGIASLADLAGRADAPIARWSVGGFSLACVTVDLGILAAVTRRSPLADPLAAWANALAGLGALLSLIAVTWQTLPAVLGFASTGYGAG